MKHKGIGTVGDYNKDLASMDLSPGKTRKKIDLRSKEESDHSHRD